MLICKNKYTHILEYMGDCRTTAGVDRKPLLEQAIIQWPTIFASIHGVYDLQEDIEKWEVPPNAIFIEVADIGDVTYTTIDPLLWELIQNRALLHDLIWTIPRPLPAELEKYEQVLKVLHVYLPGDKIYSRKLVYQPDNLYDSGWSIYRFAPPGGGGGGGGGPPAIIPFPAVPDGKVKTLGSYKATISKLEKQGIADTEFLERIKRDRFSIGPGAELRSGKRVPLPGRDESYTQKRLMEECNGKYGGIPTIYFISACAALWANEDRKATLEDQDKRYTAIFGNQRAIDIQNYKCGIKKLAFQGNSAGTISLPLEQLDRPTLRKAKAPNEAGKAYFAAADQYDPVRGVTGPTATNARVLERGTVTRVPPTADFDGPTMLLFEKKGKDDGTYTYDTVMPGGGSTNPEWPRQQAIEFASGNPGLELYTLQRDYDKLPELVPFGPPCPPGGAGGEGCAVVGGKRTKKTRRFNGKSKRTRKVKRTKRSP
jgi:hypothetical protein